MSEVALTIGGRIFRVACNPGEEDRVSALGDIVNARLATLGNLSAHEPRNLLFAALVLADEVDGGGPTAPPQPPPPPAPAVDTRTLEAELARSTAAQATLQAENEALVTELADLRAAAERTAPAPPPTIAADADLAPALEKLAEMLEQCADKLEAPAPAP